MYMFQLTPILCMTNLLSVLAGQLVKEAVKLYIHTTSNHIIGTDMWWKRGGNPSFPTLAGILLNVLTSTHEPETPAKVSAGADKVMTYLVTV